MFSLHITIYGGHLRRFLYKLQTKIIGHVNSTIIYLCFSGRALNEWKIVLSEKVLNTVHNIP